MISKSNFNISKEQQQTISLKVRGKGYENFDNKFSLNRIHQKLCKVLYISNFIFWNIYRNQLMPLRLLLKYSVSKLVSYPLVSTLFSLVNLTTNKTV